MSLQTSQGFANRAGYAFGKAVRFFLHDRNPKLKWIKRAITLVVIVVLFAQVAYWVAGALLSLGCAVLVIWALSKSDVAEQVGAYVHHEHDYEESSQQGVEEGIWREGPEGWGYYRVDDVRLDF